MQETIQHIVYEYSYPVIYVLVFVYFVVLYFVLAPIFLTVCRYLERRNLVHKIVEEEVSPRQTRYEIKHSMVSIFIFGFSGIPIVYFVRGGVIALSEDSPFNLLAGVVLLTLWNEIHFFVVHRIMHLPFFMRHIHYIHHKSTVPTVYSVYSFHWLEALLLSTVPLTLAPFISLSPLTFVVYPLASILLNYAGHCNYRFGSGKGKSWRLFATRHNAHHSKFTRNYGFATPILDKLSFLLTATTFNRKKR